VNRARDRAAPAGGAVVDAHVHFWDPAVLRYPWLDGVPSLDRAFLPGDYARATAELVITGIVFVEANCRPEDAVREVALVERWAQAEPRIAGLVAYLDVADPRQREGRLARLTASPKLKGIRQNIQGQPPGFCRRPAFVEGVRLIGQRGLPFDLCVTADQLDEVIDLVADCPETRFVLDHCGKPAIREGRLAPWSEAVGRLAGAANVCCKLSGLLTEADPAGGGEEELLPYAARVIECFGTERVMYGSDWPVLTLAGAYREWYRFTERLTRDWSPTERGRFYREVATRVYRL
jgi:L-fuconolactonase